MTILVVIDDEAEADPIFLAPHVEEVCFLLSAQSASLMLSRLSEELLDGIIVYTPMLENSQRTYLSQSGRSFLATDRQGENTRG